MGHATGASDCQTVRPSHDTSHRPVISLVATQRRMSSWPLPFRSVIRTEARLSERLGFVKPSLGINGAAITIAAGFEVTGTGSKSTRGHSPSIAGYRVTASLLLRPSPSHDSPTGASET